MFDLHQIIKLTIGSFGVNKILVCIDNFFDGDGLSIFFIDSFINDAISASSQHL